MCSFNLDLFTNPLPHTAQRNFLPPNELVFLWVPSAWGSPNLLSQMPHLKVASLKCLDLICAFNLCGLAYSIRNPHFFSLAWHWLELYLPHFPWRLYRGLSPCMCNKCTAKSWLPWRPLTNSMLAPVCGGAGGTAWGIGSWTSGHWHFGMKSRSLDRYIDFPSQRNNLLLFG